MAGRESEGGRLLEREPSGPMKFKILAFLLTAAASVTLLAFGLFRGEFVKALVNGALL